MTKTGDRLRRAGSGGAGPRYALPSDLAGSLGHLDDDQLDRVLGEVMEEAQRRGRSGGDEPSLETRSGTGKEPGGARRFKALCASSSHCQVPLRHLGRGNRRLLQTTSSQGNGRLAANGSTPGHSRQLLTTVRIRLNI